MKNKIDLFYKKQKSRTLLIAPEIQIVRKIENFYNKYFFNVFLYKNSLITFLKAFIL